MSNSPSPSRDSSADSHASVPSTLPPTSPTPLPVQAVEVPLDELPSAPASTSASLSPAQAPSSSGSDGNGHHDRGGSGSGTPGEEEDDSYAPNDEEEEQPEGWPEDGASASPQRSSNSEGDTDADEEGADAAKASDTSSGATTVAATSSTSTTAAAAPIDAPLLVPDWLPPPPSSSASGADTDTGASLPVPADEGTRAAFRAQPLPRAVEGDDEEAGGRRDSSNSSDPTTVMDSQAASAHSGAGASSEDGGESEGRLAEAPLPDVRTASDASTVVEATPGHGNAAAAEEADAGEEAGQAALTVQSASASDPAASSRDAVTPLVDSHPHDVDDEEEHDAALAASAAAITAEAVDDGVWASEDRASAALQLFSMTLHSKLVEQLIDDAAVAVGRTLQDTVQQHADRVRALMAHNRVLDRQLAGQAEQMQAIRGELEESLLQDLQRVLSVDLRQALRAASATGGSSSSSGRSSDRSETAETGTEASTPTSASAEDAPHDMAEEDARGRYASADSTDTRRDASSHASSGSATPAAAVSVEDLVAAYVQHRGTVELLERERARWRESLAALHDRLRAAASENAALRREVARLQTSTVGLEEHRAALDGRAEAEHACTLLRLQLAQHAAQAEMLEALVARGGAHSVAQPQQQASAEASPSPSAAHAVGATASQGRDAGADAEALRKGPQWDLAWRELEEQATIAANSRHLRDQLASAEARLHAAQAERDASDAYAAALKADGDVLRADLQSMVYRNSVLSQQVASLLVKVEETAARVRQAQAPPLHDSSAARTKGGSGRWPAEAAASPASPSRRSTLTALSIAASSRREDSRVSSDGGVGRLSALPSAAERRRAWLEAMWAPQAHGGATESAGDTSVLHGASSPASSYLADARAAAALAVAPTAEVEEGVQQRLCVYAASRVSAPPHYRRAASMRQLGSPVVDVERASSPQLPASDQLTGRARGRPSTFSVVDRTRGTLTRQVEGEAVTVPLTESRVRSTGELSRDPDLLRLLDTLDKDESLDRFSVNSVAELVVRNQELVQQLYEVTQRAAAAEQQAKQPQPAQDPKTAPPQAVPSARPSAPATQLPASLAAAPAALMAQTSEATAAAASRKRARVDETDTTAAAEVEHSAPAGPSPTATATATGEAACWFGEDASAAVSSMVDAIMRRREVRLTAADADVSRALLTALTAQRAADMAVVQARQTSSKDGVGLLEGAEADMAAELRASDADSSSAPSSARAMAACVRGLLQLCVRQSAALAEVALTSAQEQREVQLAVKDTWTEVQRTLLAALQTSQAVTAPRGSTTHDSSDTAAAAAAAVPPHQRVRLEATPRGSARDGDASSSLATATRLTGPHARPAPHEFRPEEQTALLEQLRTLLHTAARKDETLLHVCQAAQSRQDARQRQQKEQLTRLLLKLERKRRLIKALQQQQQQRTAAVVMVAGADAAVPGSALPRGRSHPSQPEGEPSSSQGVAGFRLSPQPGSPKWGTPPMPPMVLPTPNTADPHPLPRRRSAGSGAGGGRGAGNAEGDSSDVDSSQGNATHGGDVDVDNTEPRLRHSPADGTDSEDEDDDVLRLDMFRELQQQLALSQANHRAVQEELDAEKTRHTALLERMWVLETARDDAVAAAAAVEARMADMIPRSAHEDVEVELQSTKSALQARDAELHEARATHRELQDQLEEQRTQAEAQQREVKVERGALEEAARQQEQRLTHAKDLARQLQDQLSNARRHACDVEETIAYLRIELGKCKDTLAAREALVAELQDQLLMRADVQDLLHRLYPGDAVLHANAQLVRRLSEAHTRLQLQQAETQQELRHTRAELEQREMRLREAVQDRQAAEVRLQDALARIAAWQDTEGGALDAPTGGTEEEEAAGAVHPARRHTTAATHVVGLSEGDAAAVAAAAAHHPQTADAAARMAALFDVEAAPLTALRQRVRYLNACVAAQANDLAVLRAAEAAWKAREDDLRQQLEVMSADPVSRTARRYGLTACLTFQAQIEAMQQRQDALQTALDQLRREKADVEATVQTHAQAAAAAAAAEAAAKADTQRLTAQLETVTATCAAHAANMAALEAAQRSAEAQRAGLERQCSAVSAELAEVRSSLEAAQTRLQSTATQRDQFWQDNHLLIRKVEELEKALLQSDAEKLAAKEALAQGLSASQLGARRRRGGGGGGADSGADRYRGHTSLTQDFSLSSLTPHSP